MNTSQLQEPFLRELTETFIATERRIGRRLAEMGHDNPTARAAIIRDELRGLYHGLLVIFDGGSVLADKGMVRIVDEDGVAFDSFLHEIGFRYWPTDESQPPTAGPDDRGH